MCIRQRRIHLRRDIVALTRPMNRTYAILHAETPVSPPRGRMRTPSHRTRSSFGPSTTFPYRICSAATSANTPRALAGDATQHVEIRVSRLHLQVRSVNGGGAEREHAAPARPTRTAPPPVLVAHAHLPLAGMPLMRAWIHVSALRFASSYVGASPISPSAHQHQPTCPVSGDGSSV